MEIMKWKKKIALIAAILISLCLYGVQVRAVNQNNPMLPFPIQVMTGLQDQADLDLLIGTRTQFVDTEVDETVELNQEEYSRDRAVDLYNKVIFVGDSRFVGMQSAISTPKCAWICKTSMGYNWLVNTAGPQIDQEIVPGTAIVFNLGVNDLGNLGGYVNYLNGRATEWAMAGADLYFMSVNPVGAGYTGVVTNEAIVNFNQTMKANLSGWYGYVDTYSYVGIKGYTTVDGLHYAPNTYQDIFVYCMHQLRMVV